MSAALKSLVAVAEPAKLAPRIDLRTGLVAAGVLRSAYTLTTLTRELRTARNAWRAAGFTAPLSVELPSALMEGLDPEHLCDAAREAGCSPKGLSFELDERVLVRDGAQLAEALRARGWGVSLVADPACPLPFGKHARALYTELVLDPPTPADPYIGVDPREDDPLGRRLYAAKEAGLVITARRVETHGAAALLFVAGFDRAGGPVAAQP
ncbi:MAG: hypothetical protein AB7J28_11425 [Hyphomonadaceae bacterium]